LFALFSLSLASLWLTSFFLQELVHILGIDELKQTLTALVYVDEVGWLVFVSRWLGNKSSNIFISMNCLFIGLRLRSRPNLSNQYS
jgi:hypothetical protein